jgi:hydrogenase maturation factor
MSDACDDVICITCSDRLAPVRVDWVSDDGAVIRGVEDGELRDISAELVEGVRVGDTVLVHGGVALQRAEEAAP